MELQPIRRLSVVIVASAWPALSPRALAERAVRSVLEQSDPLGTEVVLVDGSPRQTVAEYLESIFAEAISAGRLHIVRHSLSMDLGKLRNQGATQSQGSFLAFLDSKDWWKPGRLEWLNAELSRRDLILSTSGETTQHPESADWIRTFVLENKGVTSSAVIRRTLFDELGGFPEKRPGIGEYEFWLRCLSRLQESGRRDRFVLLANRHVEIEPEPMQASPAFQKVQDVREALSLVSVARHLPKRYWPTIGKRVVEAGKGVFRRKRPG